VGLVNLESGMYGSLNELTDRYDCFTTSNNVVPTGDLSLLRSLDPLLGTDPTYDANDMVSGVMDQVRRDGQIWALPLAIEPLAMRYNPDVFAQAGAATPSMNWTVDEFELALRALKPNPDDPTPFAPGGLAGDTHLLMLIAAYGGLPIDYRTTPPTINFTDPATVAAIRQVLDLAKNDYIDYSTLVTAGGMVSIAVSSDSGNPIPLYTTTLNGLGGFGGAVAMSDGGSMVIPDNADPLILFPQGTTYTGLSYDLTAAYINANTPATDACYRFISELASHPELFPTMPVRQSLINSPEVAAEQGENMVAFYNALAALMQRPDTIEFPSAMTFDLSALGTNMITTWLNRAFDRYVKEDADLETELAEAQTYTTAFQECTASIPSLTPDQDFEAYYRQFTDCALRVDPSTSELFPQ
jgi:ABC-type glycerol-3-phosphate transport system substrate-binding protein